MHRAAAFPAVLCVISSASQHALLPRRRAARKKLPPHHSREAAASMSASPVTDARGKFLGGLKQSDFHVFDTGRTANRRFLANDDPAQVVLMMECGQRCGSSAWRMCKKRRDHHATRAHDRVAIVCYSSGPRSNLISDQTRRHLASPAQFDLSKTAARI